MLIRRAFGAVLLALSCLAVAPAGTAWALGKGEFHVFVWKLSHPDQAKPDYMAGTIHMPVRRNERVPAKVRGWIKGATRFVMEVDLSKSSPDQIQRYAILQEGRLDQMLPKPTWSKLVKTAEPMGIADDQLAQMQPWVLNLALTFPSAPPDRVVDTVLKSQARLQLVPVSYLEQPEDQLRALDAVTMDEDVRQLMETLEDPKKAERQLAEMEKAYFRGDLAKLEAFVFNPTHMARYPDFYQKIFYERNARWFPVLKETLANDDAFVAVGLGHLLGEQGLLKQFEAGGYTVERIKL